MRFHGRPRIRVGVFAGGMVWYRTLMAAYCTEIQCFVYCYSSPWHHTMMKREESWIRSILSPTLSLPTGFVHKEFFEFVASPNGIPAHQWSSTRADWIEFWKSNWTWCALHWWMWYGRAVQCWCASRYSRFEPSPQFRGDLRMGNALVWVVFRSGR